MRRLFLFIAVLFSIAAVSAPASAIAGALSQGHVIATQAVTLELCAEAVPKAAEFKPCSKRINGKAVTCHNNPMLLPADLAFATRNGETALLHHAAALRATHHEHSLYRPPRLAA